MCLAKRSQLLSVHSIKSSPRSVIKTRQCCLSYVTTSTIEMSNFISSHICFSETLFSVLRRAGSLMLTPPPPATSGLHSCLTTCARRLRAKQRNPAREKKGSQRSAQHQAAWKLPCTNTSGGRSLLSGIGAGVGGCWAMTSRSRPQGRR